jgi:hypothetical protein
MLANIITWGVVEKKILGWFWVFSPQISVNCRGKIGEQVIKAGIPSEGCVSTVCLLMRSSTISVASPGCV